jgi:low affinity Fe/Cu permease
MHIVFNPEFYALISSIIFLWALCSCLTYNFATYAGNKLVAIKITFLFLAVLLWIQKIPFLHSGKIWQWYVAMGLFAISILCNFFVRRRNEKDS